MRNFVIYSRVSTREQGISGLGLDAQLNTCREYVQSRRGDVIGEFHDVKSGSSRNRPGLDKALATAKENTATLVFAKLDRLARDAEYSHRIKNSGVPLFFCDFPEINSLMFGILVAFAQYERELGQGRTNDALNQIKRNIDTYGFHTSRKSGNAITSLGNKKGCSMEEAHEAAVLSRKKIMEADPVRCRQYKLMNSLRERGDSFYTISETMNMTGELTSTGKHWSPGNVKRALSLWGVYYG